MKKLLIVGVVLFVAVFVMAQAFLPPQLVWTGPIATNVAQCVTPAAHSASICPVEATVGSITYFLWNGTAWTPLVPATAAGVTSFNGRTGAVVSQAGDYNCAQVGCPVTSVNGKTGAVVLGATTTLQ